MIFISLTLKKNKRRQKNLAVIFCSYIFFANIFRKRFYEQTLEFFDRQANRSGINQQLFKVIKGR